jgi:hypothetical protein
MEWRIMLKLWGKEIEKKNITRNRQIWQELLGRLLLKNGCFANTDNDDDTKT